MTKQETHKIDNVEKKVDRILSYLEDDPATGRKGLVAQADENKDKITNLETDQKVKRAKMSVITIIGSAIASAGAWFLSKIME